MASPVQLGRKASIIFTSLYLAATLAVRFYIEPQLGGFLIISLGIGLFMLIFLWALYHVKFLNFDRT